MTTVAPVVLLSLLLTTGEPSSPPEGIDSLYEVGWRRGQTEFSLLQVINPPEGAEPEVFARLYAEASCLEKPEALPPELGIRTKANAEYSALMSRARTRLSELTAELRPGHTEDEDYSSGWSKALEDELSAAIRNELSASGVFDKLWLRYLENRGNETSCQNRYFDYMFAMRAKRMAPIPPDQQWKQMIDLCGGPPESIDQHIVYHLTDPRLDPGRKQATIAVGQDKRFKRCLASIIAKDSGLTARVLALDGTQPDWEFFEIRAAVHQLWREFGVPEVIEEAHETGETGERFDRFLSDCEKLAGQKSGNE